MQDSVKVFELACLLHDVGHAPFSHTLEDWYLDDGERDCLHERLAELTHDAGLEKEIHVNSYKAASHELMSAIISLRFFKKLIPEGKESFFARCITGYKYAEQMDTDKSLLNCFIELLNSEIIDVDKLDYLLRDSYMTGYDTVRIDYVRLLDSICAFKDKNGIYQVAFRKSAVSVIENVVYAHDAEKKWIQNHPVVKYVAYLISGAFETILKDVMRMKKISEEMLTEEGVNQKSKCLRLLGDSDVIYLMKGLPNNGYVREYYNRNLRRHPIWKTEAEFRAIFFGKEEAIKAIEQEFVKVKKFLNSSSLPFIINLKAMNETRQELARLEAKPAGSEFKKEQRKIALEEQQTHVRLMEILKKFSEQNDIEYDFLIIGAEQFNSGFGKTEFGNIRIQFPELKTLCRFGEVSNVLRAQQNGNRNFFYLYYKRKQENAELQIKNLVKELLDLADDLVSKEKRVEQGTKSKTLLERLK